MARYTAAVTADDDRERAYYRAVEDFFATVRGVPHVLSPRDFQLLREWWRDDVPLAAVRSGITEVFARRRERGDAEPIVSLSYCRHAVRSHARRAAEMQVGAPHEGVVPTAVDPLVRLGSLSSRLANVASGLRSAEPRAAEVIEGFAAAVKAAAEVPAPLLEEHLFALESALLANCLEALSGSRRDALDERARTEAETTAATDEARERTFRALRDRLLREELGLPRLELDA